MSGAKFRGVAIDDIDLSKCGPDSPLHELASARGRRKTKDGTRDTARELLERKARKDEEHLEQVALFEWAEGQIHKIPALALLFAIPNFAGRLGKKTALHGARLKAEGRKPGVPDLCLPVARGRYHGMWIEMKAPRGKLSTEQREWGEKLRAEDYHALVCKGWEAARDAILDYLRLDT